MGTLTKNETFQTPPSSPMPPRHARGRLEKEPSFERSSLSPSSQRSDQGLGDTPGSDGVFGGGGVGSSPRFSSPVRIGRWVVVVMVMMVMMMMMMTMKMFDSLNL